MPIVEPIRFPAKTAFEKRLFHKSEEENDVEILKHDAIFTHHVSQVRPEIAFSFYWARIPSAVEQKWELNRKPCIGWIPPDSGQLPRMEV